MYIRIDIINIISITTIIIIIMYISLTGQVMQEKSHPAPHTARRRTGLSPEGGAAALHGQCEELDRTLSLTYA